MVVRILAAVGCAVVFASAAPVAVADTGGQAADYQLDATHDGFQPDPGFTVPLKEQWSVSEPYATGNYPLIANGDIYIVVGQSLAAISLATGQTLWQDPNFAPNYAVPGLAYADGQIFSMTGQQAYDQVNPGQPAGAGVLTAFNAATGAVDWSTYLPGEYEFVTPPSVSNGYVYVTGDGENTMVYAVSAATGSLAWSQRVDGGDTSPAVTASGVYLELPCNDDYAFNPTTGALIWHATAPCSGGGTAVSVASAGDFYGYDGLGITDAPVILAADSGRQLGTFSSSGSDPLIAPAVGDGYLFTLHDGVLSATGDNGLGAVAWTFTGNGQMSDSPVVAGNVVFEGTTDGTLYALDAQTGAELWSTTFAHEFSDASFAIGDGALVVASGANLTAYTGTPVGSTTTPVGATTPAGQAAPVSAVPRNQKPPTLPRHVYVHELVVAHTGVWKPTPERYRYQWLLCNRAGARCHFIRRATKRRYRPGTRDLRHELRVRVTALGPTGRSAPAISRAVAIVRHARH